MTSQRLAKNDPARIAGLRASIKLKVLSAWVRKLHSVPQSGLHVLKTTAIVSAVSAVMLVECLIDLVTRIVFRFCGLSSLTGWRLHRDLVLRGQMRWFYSTRVVDPFSVVDRLDDAAVVFASTHYHGELDRMAIQYASGFTCATMSVVPGRYAREVEGCTGINQHSKAENVKHFQRILGLMRQGIHIWIAPEGEINEGTKLKEKMFTGCARIALDFAKDTGRPVKVVPTFINYEREQTFRTEVTISFGKPVTVAPTVSSKKSIRGIMSQVENNLRNIGTMFQCCPIEDLAQGEGVSRFIPCGGKGSRIRTVASTLLDLWRMKLVDIGIQKHCAVVKWSRRLEYLQLDYWAKVNEAAWMSALEVFFVRFGAFVDAFAVISGGVVEEACTAFEVGQHIKLFPKLRPVTLVEDLVRPTLAQAPNRTRNVKLLNVDILEWKRLILSRQCSQKAKTEAEAALQNMVSFCAGFVKQYMPVPCDL